MVKFPLLRQGNPQCLKILCLLLEIIISLEGGRITGLSP